MFDGKVKGIRPVSLVGKNPKADAKSAKDLVENARKQREARAADRLRNGSVTKIQKVLRSKVTRLRWHRQLRTSFDHSMLTGTDVQTALMALPMFFNARIDQTRLAAANKVIATMLNHHITEGNSVFRCENLLLERPLSETENASLRRVVACISLSVRLIAEAYANTQLVAIDVLDELVQFLDCVLLSEIIPALLRTVLAMLLANQTAKAVRICTSGTSTTATSSAAPDKVIWKRCRSLLRQLLDMAVNWVNNALLSQTMTPQQRALLLPYHQKSIVCVATNVLTQGVSANADQQLLSITAPEDWLFVFQHCCRTSSSPAHTAVVPLSAVETLNLLANFTQMFLAGRTQQLSQLFSFSTPANTVVDASLRELGRLFLQLASRVLGSGDRSDSSNDTAAKRAAELDANTASVGAMFGLATTVKPASTAVPSTSSSGSSALPVLWIAQELVFPSAPAPSSGFSSTLFGASSGEEDTAMAQTEETHSGSVYGDYQQASGWKKLEYRIGGVQSGIIAEQRRQWSAQRSSPLSAGQSLDVLVKYLTSREVVGAFMSNVTVPSSAATAAECLSPTKSNSSAMSVDGAESVTSAISDDMDVVQKEATTNINRIPSTRLSGAIIELYSQLLIAYPSEFVFDSHIAIAAQSALTPHSKASLLITLAFADPANPLPRRLWTLIQIQYGSLLEALVACDDSNVHRTPAFAEACQQANLAEPEGGMTPAVLYQRLLSALHLFCVVFLQQLAAVDDEELLEQQKFFSLPELRALTYFLKRWLLKLYWTDPLFDINSDFMHLAPDGCTPEKLLRMHCQLAATRLFNHFCIRNERRAFLQAEDWSWASVSGFDLALEPAHADETVGTSLLLKNAKVKAVLTFIPQVIPFKQRVSVLHGHLDIDREQYYSAVGHMNAVLGQGEGVVRVQVRRDHLVEDAFDALHAVDAKLKGRIKVEFISEQGLNEAGIDGGGLFKEFIDSLGKAAFNPAFGLFIPTSHQQLTPNPASAMVGPNHLKYFHFIGKILGKAVYERLLLESEFSAGLLNFLLDRKNSLDDLHFLDEQLHRSLMQLKHHANAGGDIESLELYFESTRSSFGHTVTAELMPGGSNVKVTRANVHAYIHQLANHKQNVEGSEQCRALRAGFQTMIPLEWVRMFSPQELQLLLSGDRRSIDIIDMKRHTHYSGGFAENQPYIQAFWQIVEEMGAEDQGHLLRFVTSCSRQPLLGFGQLNPSFAIQQTSAYASQYQGGSGVPEPGEAPRLPSAATCMNLLKLPLYDSVQTLKEKLLYAIRSNSGFELS